MSKPACYAHSQSRARGAAPSCPTFQRRLRPGSPNSSPKLHEQGAEVVGSSPAELATYVKTEIPKWAALARQADVKLD
jgi:hypothetical protein